MRYCHKRHKNIHKVCQGHLLPVREKRSIPCSVSAGGTKDSARPYCTHLQ